MTRLVLQGNGILDLMLGVALLAATWDWLYSSVGLPDPDPAIYAQIAGAFAVAVGYLLWIAHRDVHLTRAVAAASALANALLAVLAVAWLADSQMELPGHEALVLGLLVPAFGVLAAVEARIASRVGQRSD